MKRNYLYIYLLTFLYFSLRLKISHNIVHIYPIVKLTNYKNTCVELIHNISINKKMKDSPNKLHKNYINHKIKHLQFLGWNVIILYEYEWKALRNFDEKLEYIKKKFKSVKEHEQREFMK
ncbi:hypothetical protein PFAG_05815 [Plasmodium falciparum Santa Lucia]|uniref:RAP domain-containing protein n=1 Tax=Plasmodium falciparum Santa Lucia TaxID=478859 RepID=W7FQW3_PLAFA|nr:hypothetical protein PFAG_05815 [Plasmodium falciparum Santa Lucia]